jgi:hypothetical protein
MHEGDAHLRATLAHVVLTELRSGRARLSPAALAALRILAEDSAEPALSPTGVPATPRRARRTLVAVGAVTALVALGGGVILADGSNHAPSSQVAARAVADTPTPVPPNAAPQAGTGTRPPATASPSDGSDPADVPSQQGPPPATMDAGAVRTARPAVVDPPGAPQVRRESGPPMQEPTPAAAATSAPAVASSVSSSPSTTSPSPTPTPTPARTGTSTPTLDPPRTCTPAPAPATPCEAVQPSSPPASDATPPGDARDGDGSIP